MAFGVSRTRRLARSVAGILAATMLGGLATTAVAKEAPQKPIPTRPNVVVFLVDDMGFSDVGSYGSEIPTPNIDALAAGGIRFTQFYNTARCSPSRASLLTGLYPHQAGVGHLEPIVVPGSKGLHGKLEDRAVTLAEVMKSAGYFTAMAGKWHVGISHGVGPWQRGFDRSLASPYGELYFPDQTAKNAQTVYLDGRQLPSNSPEIGKDYWYSSDLFVDWGMKFVGEAEQAHKPFFLYVPFVATHFPLMAPQEEIAKFRGKYAAGWDVLRKARFERQRAMGLIAADAKLPPRLPDTYNWDKLTPEERDRFDSIMAVYAADIARMDKAVGDLVARLKAAGELDNTLILFMADNGGNAESGPDGRAMGKQLGDAKSGVWAGMNWATLQNTPFSYFKHYTEEGGISTPMIAYWPRGIDRKLHGSFVRDPGHLIDVMPTLVDVSGAHYPKTYNGHEILPMQGRSFVPAFTGKPLSRKVPIFWEHEGNRAVRDGKWKLVARFRQPWALFDMTADRTEMHDLAAVDPARVRKMAAQWDAWAAASDVDPWLDSYDPYLNGKPRQNWGGADVPKHPAEPVVD